MEGKPLARPSRLLAGQSGVRLEVPKLGRGSLLDHEDALRPVARGVAVRDDVRHRAREEVPRRRVEEVADQPASESGVHGGELGPIDAG
jgi:hypothetical protein